MPPVRVLLDRTVELTCIIALSRARVVPAPPSSQRPKYEVLDEDAGEGGEGEAESSGMPSRQKRYVLDPRKVLPLPSLQEVPLSRRKEFGKGTRVLAVFPIGGITVLYPAEVLQPPRKVRAHTHRSHAHARTHAH